MMEPNKMELRRFLDEECKYAVVSTHRRLHWIPASLLAGGKWLPMWGG